MDDLDAFWEGMLSEDPAQIRAAWERLNNDERAAVLAHLVTMATEEGWSEPQRQAAQAALDVLRGEDSAS
jgi:ParB-like chromosome segregation protein Spo0J